MNGRRGATWAWMCSNLVLFGACTAPPSRPNNAAGVHVEIADHLSCGPEGTPRPFGRRFRDFGTLMKDTADCIAEDIADGTEETKENIAGIGRGFRRDLASTGANVAGAIPWLVVDSEYHWYGLQRELSYRWRRAKNDMHCFPSRAWYDLKILE